MQVTTAEARRPVIELERQESSVRSSLGVFWARRGQTIVGFVAIVVVLALWQVAAETGLVNRGFTSAPSSVAPAFIRFVGSKAGRYDMEVSGKEYAFGLLLGMAVGLPIGLLVGWYRWIAAVMNPFLVTLNSTPLIALAPLFVIWFGLGLESKVAIVFLITVLPIVITTVSGVRSVESSLVNVARAFRANPLQLFWTLLLPGSFPAMIAGVRLAVGFGLIGVVVGEIVASTAGVGYYIESSGNSFEATSLFVGITVIVIAGLLLAALVRLIERRVQRWRL
jgi:ABC-type nitrate/sulfonate/bicarbonate transport system permease component